MLCLLVYWVFTFAVAAEMALYAGESSRGSVGESLWSRLATLAKWLALSCEAVVPLLISSLGGRRPSPLGLFSSIRRPEVAALQKR